MGHADGALAEFVSDSGEGYAGSLRNFNSEHFNHHRRHHPDNTSQVKSSCRTAELWVSLHKQIFGSSDMSVPVFASPAPAEI